MALLKDIMAHPAVRRAAARLVACYLAFVDRHTDWILLETGPRDRLIEAKRPFVAAFWHDRLALMSLAWRPGLGFGMLASEHRDGQFGADVAERFGIGRISGSTTKGGAKALRAMVQTLRSGTCVGLAPDAPRGPRMRANVGVVHLARLAGAPIVPATYAVSRRKVLRSWDRFIVPLPFGRGARIWGEPIEVPRDLDDAGIEAVRQEVEARINALVERAERAVGLEPMRPEPRAGA